MLRNYLLVALKVLRRRKFFTFISLFAVSFTLMVLTVCTPCSTTSLALGGRSPVSTARPGAVAFDVGPENDGHGQSGAMRSSTACAESRARRRRRSAPRRKAPRAT